MAGKDCGDRVVRNQAELDEVVAQPPAMLALIVESLTEMLRADQILADENFAEFADIRGLSFDFLRTRNRWDLPKGT